MAKRPKPTGLNMVHLDLFSDKSDLYAQARPQYPKELFEFIAQQVPARHCVWDCATGNGQAAVSLAEYFRAVYATDLSDQQIEQAFQRDNIHYSVQVAEKTDFSNQQFDLITVAQAVHWFDYEKFWPEVLRVLKTGGIFACWGYNWFRVTPEIDAALKEFLFDVIAPYWAPNNKIAWRGYVDIQFPFEKIATPKFELKLNWNYYQLMNYLHTWSSTRRCMDKNGTAFFELACAKLAAAWGDLESEKMIDKDFYVYIGRKI